MISRILSALRSPLDDERRACLPIQIVSRWVLISAAILEVNVRPGTSGTLYLVLNAFVLGEVAVNLLLMRRLRDATQIPSGLPILAGFYDVFAITAAVASVDHFANVNYVFYFPAFVAFSLVFPGMVGIAFTGATMAAYTAIVTMHPSFDVSNTRTVKELMVRLVTMAVATTIANMIVRIERRRRMQAVALALASHLEHQRVTQEIHDGIAQEIYMLAINLEANTKLIERQSTDPALNERMQSLVSLAKRALLETRSLLFNLSPALTGDEGLAALLRGQAAEFSAVTRIPVTVTEEGSTPAVAPDTAVELYRIVQEGLANMYRHADAHSAQLTIAHDGPSICVRLSDDGAGFDAAAPPRRGRGLTGMQARASRFGGRVVVDSTPGGGTTLTVTAPVRRP